MEDPALMPCTNSVAIEEEEKGSLETDDIISFFKDTTIFLTGVTGFLGHVLLSKLLRSCPDIRKIYILIREKKNKDINERIQEILNAPIFENFKSECPEYLHKITAINGDCLKPKLGMSEHDRSIIQEEVNVVFHIAATVNFNAPLRDAVNINVRSTSDLLDIAKNMAKLQAFVHVSTAYSFCVGRTLIEEKFYDPPITPKNLITIVDQLNDHAIDTITPALLGPYPNTYVFTKAVAENLFSNLSDEVPICVFRPAIVTSTANEPLPGWINNMYGPIGVIVAACTGLMRTLHIDKNARTNVVPCDYVINALIALAWYTAKNWQKRKEIPEKYCEFENQLIPSLFNYSNTDAKHTWKLFFMNHVRRNDKKYPYSQLIWPYTLNLNKYNLVHRMYVIFLHLIPALLFDSFAAVCGKKKKLWKSYQKIHNFSKVISYFSTRNWTIPVDNIQLLWSLLSERDKQIFDFNLDNLNWNDYFENLFIGIRVYIVKDNMDTVIYARRRRQKLLVIYYTVLSILVLLLTYFVVILCRMFF